MSSETHCQDVMQVCRNGHVVTDMLHACPDQGASHCERCGADTIDRCVTCGQELPGAVHVPGLTPIGRAAPPQFCSACGAAFPWSALSATVAPPEVVAILEKLLRRLPRVIRQLRVRQSDRPPFRVHDERDLEDLLRSLLPLHFDDVRPECRTASYALATSTDFRIEPDGVVVTVKRARKADDEKQISEQVLEDVAYYDGEEGVRSLICYVYDPEGVLHDPRQMESYLSKPEGALDVRCLIAS